MGPPCILSQTVHRYSHFLAILQAIRPALETTDAYIYQIKEALNPQLLCPPFEPIHLLYVSRHWLVSGCAYHHDHGG